MSDKFDELAKGLAQSVTRRQAFKKFGAGLAGMAVACFGLVRKTDARGHGGACEECIRNCENLFGGTKASCKIACSSVCAN